VWIAKISGVTDFESAISVDVSPEFAIGAIIDDLNEIRAVSKFDARRIFANMENCVTIAEIIPSSIDEIFEIQDICNPDMIQINGKFFDDINNLIAVQSIATIPIIGSIFINKESLESNILDSDPIKAAQMLDSYVHAININLPLGLNWDSKKKKEELVSIIFEIKNVVTKPLIIGGGLKTSNIGKIAKALSPNAVDISSGVEKIPGIKNPELMQEFLETVYDFKEYLIGV
jgi:phosphoribosylanthranilate isomerase